VTTRISMKILEDQDLPLSDTDRSSMEAAMGAAVPGANILAAAGARYMSEVLWKPLLRSYYFTSPEEDPRVDADYQAFMSGNW
jgi:hypothetical protein